MSLKTKVIINTVNNLSDARYCAGMGVDYLGFNLEENSPNFMSLDKFKELTSWIQGPVYVGEFQNSSAEVIKNTSTNYSIKTIQVSNYQLINDLHDSNLLLILEIDAENLTVELLDKIGSRVEFIVCKISNQDISQIERISDLALNRPIFLAGDFSQDILNDLPNYSFEGISLKGGNEIKPGFREFDEMADILENLETDF